MLPPLIASRGWARYSNKTGAMYFGHPGEAIPGPNQGTRSNYTILQSLDEGRTWEFLEVVFPKGSGYSDMHLLPTPADADEGWGDLLGLAFQKCEDIHQRQTSGMSMGWAVVHVPVRKHRSH